MINFVNPFYLVLAVFAIAWGIYRLKTDLLFLLRMLPLLLLICAIARPVMKISKLDKSVIWCVDRSSSIPDNEKKEIYKFLKKKHSAPVFFADTAEQKQIFTEKDFESCAENGTKIIPVLKYIDESIRNNGFSNVVIFTDGNLSDAEIFLSMIKEYRNKGAVFNFFPTGNSINSEVSAGEAEIYDATKIKVPFYAFGNVSTAEISFENDDGLKIFSREIDLSSGYGEIKLNLPEPKQPVETYYAVIDSDNDAFSQNNRIKFIVKKSDKRKILRLSAYSSSGLIGNMLKDKFEIIEAVSRADIDKYLPLLSYFDLILLDDLPAYLLSPQQMISIAEGVKNYGIGLIMTGLYDSFARGGYSTSEVEKALPVTVRPSGPDGQEDFIILVDKSGSMEEKDSKGITRLQYSFDALYRILRDKKESERYGIIVFDTKAHELIPLSGSITESAAKAVLSKIEPHGGTDLLNALSAVSVNRRNKVHFILLTDGQTDKKEECLDIVSKLSGANSSLSVIGIGADKSDSFLVELGKRGNGRTYIVDDLSVLSQIFFRETEIEKGENIVESPVFARINPDGEIFSAEKQLSVLKKYARLKLKESASAIIESPSGDPVAAVWRYGLGKAVVFACETESDAVSQWIVSGEYREVLAPIFDYCAKYAESKAGTDYQWKIHPDHGYVLLNFAPENINLAYPNGKEKNICVYPSSDKSYAVFDADQAGIYHFNIYLKTGEKLHRQQMISYPQEFKKLGANYNFFYVASSLSGGKIFLNRTELHNFIPAVKKEIRIDLSNILIIISLCLFIIELASRRKIRFNQLYEIWKSHGIKSFFRQIYIDK